LAAGVGSLGDGDEQEFSKADVRRLLVRIMEDFETQIVALQDSNAP
jgi:hypothetical protein